MWSLSKRIKYISTWIGKYSHFTKSLSETLSNVEKVDLFYILYINNTTDNGNIINDGAIQHNVFLCKNIDNNGSDLQEKTLFIRTETGKFILVPTSS